jgi:hypothetical protein
MIHAICADKAINYYIDLQRTTFELAVTYMFLSTIYNISVFTIGN